MRVVTISYDSRNTIFKFYKIGRRCGVYDRANPTPWGKYLFLFPCPCGRSCVALWLRFLFRWCVGVVPCLVSVRCGAFCDVVIFHAQIKKTASVATGGKNKRECIMYDDMIPCYYYNMVWYINLFQFWTSVLYKTHDKLFFVLRFISASVARFPIS